MQSVTLQIQDDFMPQFLDMIGQYPKNIKLENSSHHDPYFNERRQKLDSIREGVAKGEIKLLNEEEANRDIERFLTQLETDENR